MASRAAGRPLAAFSFAHGRLEREQGVIHVVADRLENLSEKLRAIAPRARDFR